MSNIIFNVEIEIESQYTWTKMNGSLDKNVQRSINLYFSQCSLFPVKERIVNFHIINVMFVKMEVFSEVLHPFRVTWKIFFINWIHMELNIS